MGRRLTSVLGRISNYSPGRSTLRRFPVWIDVRSRNARFRYFSPPNDDLRLRALASFEGWEDRGRDLLSQASRNAEVIVDVGAYTGVYSLTAAACNREIEVFAVEPSETAARAIEKSARANGFSRISVIRAVASRDSDSEMILLGNRDRGTSTHSVEPGFHAGPVEAVGRARSIRLDSLRLKRVDFLKIDVEGHELAVLEGASNILARFVPVILVECLDGDALSSVAAFARLFGYRSPVLVDEAKRNFLFLPDSGRWSQWRPSIGL